jgi:cholesterol transport system auxiliary component
MNFDSQRTARYANSRWTMSPARLLTERLRTSLGAQATVLSGADSVQAPMLKVELYEFEQVFESSTESSGVLSARATLMQGGKVLAQRSFVTRAPASTPDAAGGVRALQAASDDFANQLGAWLSAQSIASTP